MKHVGDASPEVRRSRGYVLLRVLPAASYALFLSLTFFQERFREASDPFLLVPLAALLSDLRWGTEELGWRRARPVLAAICVIAVVVVVALFRRTT